MKILVPNFILLPTKVVSNLAIAFDKKIEKIAPLSELQTLYPNAKVTQLPKNSLLMPGLINAHVHLEFSANETELQYGSFLPWLYSVIQKREDLINGCQSQCIENAIDMMLQNGITSFGAISSHAADLEACANAPQNVVFFNELIGSQAAMADALFGDFLARLDASKEVKKENFYPAVAIHSPYSVHPILIKKALKIVKNENLKLTAHLLESPAEKEWLENNSGEFAEFFEKFLQQKNAVTSIDKFLEHFNSTQTLFTHVIQTTQKELEILKQNNHTVIHCPISNRLLGNGKLNIKELQKQNIRWIIASDGLSSNYTLNLFEEMKIALFMQEDLPLNQFAKQLLNSATKDAADALGLNSGEIAQTKDADMLVLQLNDEPTQDIALHLILQNYPITQVYVQGELKKDTL